MHTRKYTHTNTHTHTHTHTHTRTHTHAHTRTHTHTHTRISLSVRLPMTNTHVACCTQMHFIHIRRYQLIFSGMRSPRQIFSVPLLLPLFRLDGYISYIHTFIHARKKRIWLIFSVPLLLSLFRLNECILCTYRFIHVIYLCMRLKFLGLSLASLIQVDRI